MSGNGYRRLGRVEFIGRHFGALAQVTSVTLDRMDVILDRDAEESLVAKISADEWEVNVRASDEELLRLRDIRTADWNERRSIRAGQSADAAVFWAHRDATVTLMLGHYDQTWDVAVVVPVSIVDEIVRQAERL